MLNHFEGATVLVLGLGESGLAMARWCARFGATVRVWDSRLGTASAPAHAAVLRDAVPNLVFIAGALTDAAFDGVTRVLKSPGLAPTDERIAGPLQRAAERGVLVQGELELFAMALGRLKAERGYAPKVLAITGTNGKTTTTAMAAMLIVRTGRRVAAAGNIGPTMLQTLADALDLEPLACAAAAPAEAGAPVVVQREAPDDAAESALPTDDDEPAVAAAAEPPAEDDDTPVVLDAPPPAAPTFTHLPEVWVLELSSFQLDEAKGFEPSAGAVLNITQDHLDWHGSMAHYTAAKARVFGQHAVMVVNRDDAAVERLVPAPEFVKGVKGRKAHTLQRTVVRFGLGAPQHPGDFGLVEENGMAWLVRAREIDETLKPVRAKRGEATAHAAEPLLIQRLMPADALRVRGRHNATNALAALALATAIDCPLAPMLHGLREYAGEPHRVQFITTVDGVDAFDDSKGTNVGATVAALQGLGADKAPAKLVLILGGDGKGQDFAPLVAPVQRHARALALIGHDAERLQTALAESGVPMQRFESLELATRWCFERAHAGDAVLLSPACASLDMFRNYGHRAEVFTAEVHAIAADRGGVAA